MCEDSGMRATGIPTHIGLMLKIKDLTNEIEQLRSSVNTGHGRLFDELPLLISDHVERRIRSSFHVEGVIPLTTADLERSISTLRTDVHSMLQRQQKKRDDTTSSPSIAYRIRSLPFCLWYHIVVSRRN